MSFIITDGIGIVIPIDRSGGPKIAGLHRVIPLANGPNCDLIPKLLSFSFHHAAFGAQSLGTQRAVANLVQPLLGSCFRDDDRFFFFPMESPLPLCSCSPSLTSSSSLPFPTFHPCEFQGEWNPYVFYSFALNSSKYDFERGWICREVNFKVLFPWKTGCLFWPKS